MSRLRGNPQNRRCQNWLGLLPQYGEGGGLCGEAAVIRCNACKEYFCEECWEFHLEMTIVTTSKGGSNEQWVTG